MTAFLRLLALSVALISTASSTALAAPSSQGTLVDPNLVFLEDAELPRGFQRLAGNDSMSADNGVITAVRNYSDGEEIIQQVVFSTASPDTARDLGGEYITKLIDEQNGDFRDVITLGDRAATGYGVDETGASYHAVVFQRDRVAAAILWIMVEERDLEAETVALAARMEARARAAVTR